MILSSSNTLYILGIAGSLVIIILTLIIIMKSERLKQVQLSLNQLNESLKQMDEQAKLIVRTDLELNKIQEELDKKISGLYIIQMLQRTFASTLDEKEIFNKIKSEHIEALGMQKALGFIWQEKTRKFSERLAIGYTQEERDSIQREIENNQNIYLKLISQEKTLSSREPDTKLISIGEIKKIFRVDVFCLSPILPKEGDHGFIFVGTSSVDFLMSEGDEELITILAHSIGQALENASLFEATWRAQQELEKRVEQRTQELTEAVDELKRVSKRKTDFVSAVSHELRTPLTSIKGYASILISKGLGEISEPIKERLIKINRHSDELVQMVNNLLDISRLESGKIIIKKQRHNLKELVEDMLDLLSVQIKSKGISFSANIPAEFEVVIDKSQIERVFINLVGNAVKFTPENGRISITAERENNFVRVNVSDSGIGIPKEAQASIFEEFYRVDNPINEKVKGTGLGLSLVKSIIQAHQGSIWVESQPGAGSTFSFLLPTEEIAQESIPPANEA